MKLQILRKLIPIACLLVSMNVLAYDFKSGGIYYNITSSENKTVEVTYKDTNYKSYSGDVTIPSSVTHEEIEYSVTSIGDYAFLYCSGLTSVTIGDSVTSIGDYAFSFCSGLRSVTISNSVTQIGNYVFEVCTSLKDLKIEDGTEILELGYNSSGEGLFYDCPLETVYLGRNLSYNTSYSCGYSPFYNQIALKTITIGNGVTSIGDYAFSYCSFLTSVTFESITPPSIGKKAFYLVNATFKVPFTSILAYKAIAELKDKTFGGFEVDGIYYLSTSDMEVEVTFKDKNYKSYTGEVVIPSEITVDEKKYNVTSIGKNTFANCSGLTSVTIPNSVTSIGGSAFSGCSGLTSITIPNSVISVDNYAFNGCTSLKDLKIEDGTEILELGYNYYNSNYSTGKGLFYDCPLETVYLGRNLSYNTSQSYGYSPFYNQKALKSITIGNSVTSIGDYAFSYCSGLTSVTFESITPPSIGQNAFYNVDATFKTPFASVLAYKAILKDKAFASHEVEGFYYMPTSETEVEVTLNPSKYSGDVVIPLEITVDEKKYNVTSIGKNAFTNCSGLTSITIPNSVTSVGNYAFDNCTSLKDLKIEDGTEILELGYNNYGPGLFYDCPLETVYLGRNLSYNTSYSYGYSAFYNQKALKAITIGNSVTSIGDYAFLYCSGLTSVTIGNRVTSIGDYAFSGCKIKKTIWLTNTPPQGYANLSSAVHYVANDQYASLNNVTIYPYLSSMF